MKKFESGRPPERHESRVQRSAEKKVAGRFAPTPSGPLHIGSLIAAVASRCDALSLGGRWQVRIDDIDPPREQAGAAAGIQATLARFGLAPDGAVLFQSSRHAAYQSALHKLIRDGLLFRCHCTRRVLQSTDHYPGTCRSRSVTGDSIPPLRQQPHQEPDDALRLRIDQPICIEDLVQGTHTVPPDDTVLQRRDGLVAYSLACAVDDADVARVVRGADLLQASAAQIAVLEKLGLTPPQWVHVPVAVDNNNDKLGKSTNARSLDSMEPLPALLSVWDFLGQAPLEVMTIDEFWREAPAAWSLARVPRVLEKPAPAAFL